MKTYLKIAGIFLAVLFSSKSFGQTWKNDPGYSIHNYKHPNKAKAARQNARVSEVKYLQAMVPVSSNYKAQNLVFERKKEVVQVWGNNTDKMQQNYKQQFAPTRRRR